MIKRILLVTISVFLFAGTALAEQQSKPAKHSPEWTNPNDSDPGVTRVKKAATLRVASEPQATESVVPELSRIVVLCAQEEKEKFKEEWGKYVNKHDLKGAELENTINEVSDRAEIYRAKELALEEDEEESKAWKAERRRIMNEVIGKALNPVR